MPIRPYLQGAALHNARLPHYRHPLGAVRQGGQLTLRVDLRDFFRDAVVIASIHTEGRDKLLEMHDVTPRQGCERTVEVTLGLPDTPGLLWYHFIINDRTTLYYLGKPESASGRAHLSHAKALAFQVTVYRPQPHVDWALGVNCYQIFVDRFARPQGTCGGLERLDEYKQRGWRAVAHEDWSEEPNYLPFPGERYYDPCDFSGGDLYGVAEKLPYLHDMGVGLLYLNPVFEAPSNHKYDTSDYSHVDPVFGGDAGLKYLLEKADGFGIRVILDGVFSHTGKDSVYFDANRRYGNGAVSAGEASPYYKWYSFDKFPDKYRSWWGFETLPEVNELEPSYVEFIATGENSVINDYARRGTFGWRLDVADELPDAFIAHLRTSLKAISPDSLLIGEVWEDASDKFSLGEQRKYALGAGLDGVMNYVYRTAILDFLMDRTDAQAFADAVLTLYDHYPKPFLFNSMTLLSTHDVPRARTVLSGAPDTEGVSQAEQHAYRPSEANLDIARKKQRLAVLMQAMLPGMPTVYYADEAGAQGMSDPFNRGTFPWDNADAEMTEWYKNVLCLHKAKKVLQTGSFTVFAPRSGVVVLLRFSNGQDDFSRPCEPGLFCACVNRSQSECVVDIPIKEDLEGVEELPDVRDGDILTDAFTGRAHRIRNGRLRLLLPPFGCVCLEKQALNIE